ncbi:hypothetical protein KNV66_gp33 [Bacillus phage DLc1]|uniref:Uncharacterized protein n=1 Tax=Bacillus phage DLc1 TaxID=2777318 RepID=A0A7M1RT96_9CAUD|nr:hypothetical protein KNV66_gp33 [Bacillus phage DLc1]QOR56270.1 hypothetical protein [Bacillus phage DLc1]
MMYFGWYMVMGLPIFITAKWFAPEIMEETYNKLPLDKNIIDCIFLVGICLTWLPMLFIVIPKILKERKDK